MDVKQYMQQLGQQARLAGREISKADSGRKNNALLKIAENFMNWNGGKIIFDKTKNGYYHPVKTVIN